jgi:hypothetical protein
MTRPSCLNSRLRIGISGNKVLEKGGQVVKSVKGGLSIAEGHFMAAYPTYVATGYDTTTNLDAAVHIHSQHRRWKTLVRVTFCESSTGR